jgi:septation ring formation regulator EzrA
VDLVVQVLVGINLFITILGYVFIKPITDKLTKVTHVQEVMQKEISDYKLHVAETYVSNAYFKEYSARIEKALDEIKELIQEIKQNHRP